MRFDRTLLASLSLGAVTLVIGNQMFLAPHAKKTAMRQVFDGIMARKLKPDSKGVVALPPNLSKTSVDGHAYVTKAKNQTMVFFPSWFGKGANVQGTLICSKPLNPAQQSIEVIYPQLWGASTPQGFHETYGPHKNKVPIEEKLAGNTYLLYYGMD